MSSSDWKEGANKRRDERHIKIEEKPSNRSKKKDTKRFCKGKVGVLHKPVCKSYNEIKKTGRGFFNHWRLLICETCGKELDMWAPHAYNKRNKPDWVSF